MRLNIKPGCGAGPLVFGENRTVVRMALEERPFRVQLQEPENDFYENEGLILGYDEKDCLEYIEIIKPSSAEFDGIEFFALDLTSCIKEMNSRGYYEKACGDGYQFADIEIAFFCPIGKLESVSIYKSGYYDQ